MLITNTTKAIATAKNLSKQNWQMLKRNNLCGLKLKVVLKQKPDVRQFISTRSGFGGIQRTGSAIWSGNTAANWDNVRDQIASGVITGLAGMPN